MTEATLTPEIDAQLIEQADLEWQKAPWGAAFKTWYLNQLRAAANVAVEGERKSCRDSFERMSAANQTGASMTKATLEPETLKELEKMAQDSWMRWIREGENRTSFSSWQFDQFCAAATVAVEGEQHMSTFWMEEAKRQEGKVMMLQSELAALRNQGHGFAKVTVEEAQEAMRAGYKYSGFPGLAVEIDKLMPTKLISPAALCPSEGGVGIEERCYVLSQQWKLGDAVLQDVQRHLEQAVAEAVIENNRLHNVTLRENEQRHAKELQEAVAAERNLLAEARADERERHGKELQEAVKTNNACMTQFYEKDLAKLKTDHASTYKAFTEAEALRKEAAVSNALAQERANWQARMAQLKDEHGNEIRIMNHACKLANELKDSLQDRISEAVAAAYEEVAHWIETEIHEVYECDKDIAEYVRQLAANKLDEKRFATKKPDKKILFLGDSMTGYCPEPMTNEEMSEMLFGQAEKNLKDATKSQEQYVERRETPELYPQPEMTDRLPRRRVEPEALAPDMPEASACCGGTPRPASPGGAGVSWEELNEPEEKDCPACGHFECNHHEERCLIAGCACKPPRPTRISSGAGVFCFSVGVRL